MAFGITICSNALLMLGANPISDFNEDSDRAKLCSNIYPNTRDSLLRAHPWNCVTKRVVLSPDTNPPPFGYQYSYPLPGDFLRLLSLNTTEFSIENNRILCDINQLQMRYIWRNEDDQTWDSGLSSVAELFMAAKMAYAITGSSSLRDSFFQEAGASLKLAKAVSGQENPPETLYGSLLIEARQ